MYDTYKVVITKKLVLNYRLRMLKPLLCNNKYTSIITKLLIYKTLLKLLWTYSFQLWGNLKKTNILKNQTFQNIAFRKLMNVPPYVSNRTLHTDLKLTPLVTSNLSDTRLIIILIILSSIDLSSFPFVYSSKYVQGMC